MREDRTTLLPSLLLLAALVLLLAGCIAPTDGDAGEGGATATAADVGATDSTTDGASSVAANLSSRAEPVTVVEVTDGDTVDVRYRNGTTETVRLLGVDTPEVHVATDPGEFGVPDTAAGRSCLREWGGRASAALAAVLDDGGDEPAIGLATDPVGDRRGGYGRLLGYLVLPNGTAANAVLLGRGLARHYDSAFSRNGEYAALEREARAAERGLWTCRDPAEATTGDAGAAGAVDAETGLAIATINADAPGNDHEAPNGEYVVFANEGDAALDLAGYAVEDEAGHTYRFPDGVVLDPGASVALRTGAGDDGDGVLHWGRDRAVWNNGGDTVTVRDGSDAVVVRESY